MTKNENSYITGIIAEYNPLHKGHAWHIEKAKEVTGAGFCAVVMSGDFVQRGAPAVFDKYTRTAMALDAGADLVLEMPSIFAVSSAEDFAACGIALLDRLGAVGSVCFGSECGEIGELTRAASILAEEPPAYTGVLREQLKNGYTYPQARAHALSLLGEFDEALLSSPNNILGIEYVKALIKRNSSMRPVTILRRGSGYHDTGVTDGFCSATAVRKALKEAMETGNRNPAIPAPIKEGLPDYVKQQMKEALPIFTDDLSALLNSALLKLDAEGVPLSRFSDVSNELAARIGKELLAFSSFEERTESLKSRQYTYTRISRALLHILLGITDREILAGRAAGYAPYARVLGFRRSSSAVLTDIKKRGSIPLITKTADAESILAGTALEMFKKDLFCSHLYQAVISGKYHTRLKNEFTHSVVIRP